MIRLVATEDAQREFARLVAAGTPAADAARQVGYHGSREVLRVHGSRMLRRPLVQAELHRFREKADVKAVASREELLSVLTGHVRANLRDCFSPGPNGRLVFDAERALRLGRRVKLDKDGQPVEVELHSVQHAAELLARLTGVEPPRRLDVTATGNLLAGLTDEQVRALAKEVNGGG